MRQPHHHRIILAGTVTHMLRQAGWILLAAAAAALVSHQFRGSGASPPPMPAVGISNTTVFTGPKMIDVDTAFRWFDNGSAIFIDARDKYDFADSHVPEAIHLDLAEAEDWMMEIYRNLPRDGWIIVYADGAGDTAAPLLAERLTQIGFSNVFYLGTGWPGWLARGLPFNDAVPAAHGLEALGKTLAPR